MEEGVHDAQVKTAYPVELRQQIIELVRAGRTPVELSRELGCSSQAIHN